MGSPHVHGWDALASELFFMYTTILIAVPTGVKYLTGRYYVKGTMTLKHQCCCFGIRYPVHYWGILRLMLGVTPVDFQYPRPFFVVHISLCVGNWGGYFDSCHLFLAAKWTGTCTTKL